MSLVRSLNTFMWWTGRRVWVRTSEAGVPRRYGQLVLIATDRDGLAVVLAVRLEGGPGTTVHVSEKGKRWDFADERASLSPSVARTTTLGDPLVEDEADLDRRASFKPEWRGRKVWVKLGPGRLPDQGVIVSGTRPNQVGRYNVIIRLSGSVVTAVRHVTRGADWDFVEG
jgi:hypothetical protein